MKKAPGVRHTIQSEPNAPISSRRPHPPLSCYSPYGKRFVLQRPTHPLCMFFVWIDQPWKIGIRDVHTISVREQILKIFFTTNNVCLDELEKKRRKNILKLFQSKESFLTTSHLNVVATFDLKGGIMSTRGVGPILFFQGIKYIKLLHLVTGYCILQ